MLKAIIITLFLTLISIPGMSQNAVPDNWKATLQKTFDLYYTDQDAAITGFTGITTTESIRKTETFFGKPFPQKVKVYLFPNRAELDKQWQKDWNAPDFKSQCWMVASGVAHRLDVLSPNVWKNEACEHQFSDSIKTRQLIFHEVVHVFHGQQNPNPSFDGMDDLGWFVEGLATYVSGQVDEERMKGVLEFVKSEKSPKSLSKFWSGKYKYGVSGSLIQFIDKKYGRNSLIKMIGMTAQSQLLSELNTSEEQLIADWKQYLATGKLN